MWERALKVTEKFSCPISKHVIKGKKRVAIVMWKVYTFLRRVTTNTCISKSNLDFFFKSERKKLAKLFLQLGFLQNFFV